MHVYPNFPPGGTESFPCSTTPVKVSLPSGVSATAIAGNVFGGTAIGSDNNVYAWGAGNLGNGSSGGSDSPVVVSLLTGSAPVSLGQGSSARVSYAIVNAPDVAPSITTNPTSQSVYAGLPVSFSAAANGNPTPAVQWQVSTDGGVTFAPLAGATSDTLTITSATLAENGNEYEAVFTNGTSPDATTTAATLTVTAPVAPVVTTDPLSQSVAYGGTLTFSVAASGAPSPTVAWQVSVDGGSTWIDVSGTTTNLTTGPLTSFENGWEVRAVFTNIAGSAMTKAATITVVVPAPSTSVALPADGATVSGGTWLDASAQSPVGIASVHFEVSGGLVSDLVVASGVKTVWGWIGGWDATDVPNGTYTVQSVATDTQGHSSTSAGITVTVANPALHTQVLVPSAGATLSGTAVVLDASAAGDAHISGVQFVVTGGSLSDHVVGTAVLTLYGWIAQWNTTTVTNGTYTLQSVATETGGTTAMSPPISVTVADAG